MFKKIIWALIWLLLLGCQSSQKTERAIDKSINKSMSDIQLEQARQIYQLATMTFPISDDPHLLSLHSHQFVNMLTKTIGDYRRVYGHYPETLKSYLDSGFPLLWPRNVVNGFPVKILNSRNVRPESEDYGVVKWSKQDDYHSSILTSNIDGKAYSEGRGLQWIVEEKQIGFYLVNDYMARPRDDLEEFLKHTSPYSLEGATTIVGGTNAINLIEDEDPRLIYAMCGQLTDFVFSTTVNFYSKNQTLPRSFVDVLTFQQGIGQTPLIVKENFYHFGQMLKDANIEFKVGYDYAKTTSYALLIINGETLISHCYKYDYIPKEEEEDKTPGIHVGCKMDELDMSLSIISDENLLTLEIPNECLISVKDIPME